MESIGSFLQKKCNTALSKGLIAIKSDQSLAWNSIKQLEDDFLLFGKYNLDSLEKIIYTINHLGDRVHQMEKLLLGKDHIVATQQFLQVILEDCSLLTNLPDFNSGSSIEAL